ncbi:uncharacterized protein LOC123678105 [Harmonia axyridis]|uniref:uncharacterized protein LOC123678105 n=1 Tax=Harmonia axyridis TaxID=115357 RepID=UPI001E27912F|nr:uncharacterized protein LOC123678105 [Harmonia axyridis]
MNTLRPVLSIVLLVVVLVSCDQKANTGDGDQQKSINRVVRQSETLGEIQRPAVQEVPIDSMPLEEPILNRRLKRHGDDLLDDSNQETEKMATSFKKGGGGGGVAKGGGGGGGGCKKGRK